MNDSWGVILKKQTDASTDIVHGVKFVRPLHLSSYHVTMSTFILGDMYLDPDVITITIADDCADVYLPKRRTFASKLYCVFFLFSYIIFLNNEQALRCLCRYNITERPPPLPV